MKKGFFRAAALTAALAAAVSLCACGTAADSSADTETDSTKWGTAAADTITLPEGVDSTALFAATQADSSMYIVFNGIQKRDTGYFSAPNGTLTFTTAATAEDASLQKFKVAVWKLVDGGTQYVNGSTIYFKTDGTVYTYTIDGLDAAASYRLTISYDRSSYYLYGQMRVDGVAAMAAAPQESDSSASA